METTFNRIVRFVCDGEPEAVLTLALEGEFVWTGGMEPSIAVGVIDWLDYEKIKANPGRTGTLEFWWSHSPDDLVAEPDVKFVGMKIVELDAFRRGRLPSGVDFRTVLYRVAIADVRQRFVCPRGGALFRGEINTTPINQQTGKDKNGRPMKSNRELLAMCLEAMGCQWHMEGNGSAPSWEHVVIPAAIDAAAPVVGLQWDGTHAPTALADILRKTGAVLVPKADGTIGLAMTGVGTPVGIPAEQLTNVECPGIDRRARVVILTSAPNAIIDRITITGQAGGGDGELGDFWFVNRDVGAAWAKYATCALMGGKTGQQWFNKDPATYGIAGAAPYDPETVRGYVWGAIRLDPAKFPMAVLREPGLAATETIVVKATRAVRVRGGWFENRADTTIGVKAVLAGNVLILEEPLFKVNVDTPVQVEAATVSVTFSTEAHLPDGSPDHYFAGFAQGPDGSIEVLNAGAVAAALANPTEDTIIVGAPSLQLYRVNGADQNRAEVDAAARAMAAAYFPSQKPAEQWAYGFAWGGDLNGVLSEVKISQEPPLTVFRQNSWGLPRGTYYHKEAKIWAKEKDKGPVPGGAVQSGRSSSGAAGYVQPAVPAMPMPTRMFGGVDGFWALITGSLQDGGNKRWLYAWSEATKSAAGYGGWTAKAGGRTGESGSDPLYNATEAMNGANGLYGNGVNSANLLGTFDVQPIPDGTPVWVWIVTRGDGSIEYWTCYENGVDGECP